MKSKVKSKSKVKTNIILLILVVVIAVVPLMLNSKANFGGSDDAAEGAIMKINHNYKPWFSSLFKPASDEIESLLFSVQAAIGAGIVGYVLGRWKRE